MSNWRDEDEGYWVGVAEGKYSAELALEELRADLRALAEVWELTGGSVYAKTIRELLKPPRGRG